MGPSGSGKTTLMRAIVDVRIGYMTQAPSVYGDLAVRENLGFFAAVLGVADERIDAVIEAVMATPQVIAVRSVSFELLGLDTAASVLLVGALAVSNAILGMALGLFVSAFAATEFQAVQFLPASLLPQLLLCGLFVPREQMAAALCTASDAR
jgi:hypothetical protein